jgi:hypothetical protein
LLLWRVFLPLLQDIIEPTHPAHFDLVPAPPHLTYFALCSPPHLLMYAYMYPGFALVSQVIEMMCNAVSDTGCWDLLGATIVSFCIRSSVVAMGLSAADANSILYQSIMEADFPAETLSCLLPLSNSSSVLASLLVDMLERRRTIPTSQEGAADLDALVQNLTWDLAKLVLKMFTHAQEYRSCATRVLLQPVLISLTDVSSVTVSFGAVQHKLSRLLRVHFFGNYAVVNSNCSNSSYLLPAGLVS